MAFTKKTWVNVPNPDDYSGDTPLSDLPRFDANNMNRIEDGIKEHTEDMVLHNKSDEGGAFGIEASATSGGAVGYQAQSSSGGAIGYKASTTTGAAIGSNTEAKNGGAAVGSSASATKGVAAGVSAKETSGGGAVGHKASTTSGGAVGDGAMSESGGAVGKNASSGYGGAVGDGAKSDNGGGAVGYGASTNAGGGAVGRESTSENGGFAGGYKANSLEGGAIGTNARATSGFSGGKNAKASVDAIQLGAGTNEKEKTLQVYDHTLMNADGSIPNQRMFTLIKTMNINLSAPKGVTTNTVNITGIDVKKYSELEFVFDGTISLSWYYEKTTQGHTSIKLYIGNCTLCEAWQEISGKKIVNTNFQTVSNLNLRYSGFTYLISNLDSSMNPTEPKRRFTGGYVAQSGASATTETGDFIFKIDNGSDHTYLDDYNASVVGTLYVYGKELVE